MNRTKTSQTETSQARNKIIDRSSGPSLLRRRKGRNGLSLLEVMVSIAVLGVALTVIGHAVHVGSKAATGIRVASEGQILCDTKMAEISSGVIPLQNASDSAIEERPRWTYSVEVRSAEITGLKSVSVTVRQPQSPELTTLTLTRLIPDPDYEPEQSVLQ